MSIYRSIMRNDLILTSHFKIVNNYETGGSTHAHTGRTKKQKTPWTGVFVFESKFLQGLQVNHPHDIQPHQLLDNFQADLFHRFIIRVYDEIC